MKRLEYILVAIFALGLLCQKASAATKTFYYVSQPYEIVNWGYLAPDYRWVPYDTPMPLIRTASLTVDLSAFPGGNLAGQRVAAGWDGSCEYSCYYNEYFRTPGFVAATLDWSPPEWGINVRVGFDSQGGIETWRMDNYEDWLCTSGCLLTSGDRRSGTGSDATSGMWGLHDWLYTEAERRAVLTALGYRDGTAAYRRYFEDDAIWDYETFAPGPGQWFDSLFDFARQIEANTAFAMANPPRGIAQIAPIPLPPGLALVLGGLAALAFAGRRRGTAGPGRARVAPTPTTPAADARIGGLA
jgi:hypothetical protein